MHATPDSVGATSSDATKGSRRWRSHRSPRNLRALGTPFTLGGFQPQYCAGPKLNGDQRAILADLGYDAAAIAGLAAARAFGKVAGDAT